MPEDSILTEEKNDGRKAERRPKSALPTSSENPPSVKERKPRVPRKSRIEKEGGKAAFKPSLESAEKPKVVKKVSEKTEPKVEQKEKPKHAEKLFAVVMVRGVVGTDRRLKDTLRMLRLDRINHCVVVPKNQNYDGMLHKARNFVTWGEIDQETLEKMVAKRGRFAGDKRVTDLAYAKELAQLILSGKKVKDIGIKPVFRLSPPSKGYKSTKVLYPRGSLGYRGEKINELLKRMI
jgi:large subunit ribosomal protein L30